MNVVLQTPEDALTGSRSFAYGYNIGVKGSTFKISVKDDRDYYYETTTSAAHNKWFHIAMTYMHLQVSSYSLMVVTQMWTENMDMYLNGCDANVNGKHGYASEWLWRKCERKTWIWIWMVVTQMWTKNMDMNLNGCDANVNGKHGYASEWLWRKCERKTWIWIWMVVTQMWTGNMDMHLKMIYENTSQDIPPSSLVDGKEAAKL